MLNNKVDSIKSTLWFTVGFGVMWFITARVITNDRYIPTAIFLLSVVLGMAKYFRKELYQITKNTNFYEIFTLVGTSLLIHSVTIYCIRNYVQQPAWPFDSRGSSFLLMNQYYVWAKPIDVLVQQLLIVLLVTRLNDLGASLNQITRLFVIGFGLIHIFQIFNTDLVVALAYALMAIIYSYIFPRMILLVRNGYIYNFMIHLATYNLAAILAWTLY